MLTLFSPIFFDISNFRFVLNNEDGAGSPVHLGFLILGSMIISNFMRDTLRGKFQTKNILFTGIFLLLISASLLFTHLNIITLIQFLSLLIYMSAGLIITSRNLMTFFKISIFANTGQLIIFALFNFVSGNVLGAIWIYQSLVTFPATLILYCYALLCFVPLAIEHKGKILLWFIFVQISLVGYILINLGRRVSLIDMFILIIIISLIIIHYNIRKVNGQFKVKWQVIIFSATFLPLLGFFLINTLLNSNIALRIQNSISSNDLDGSRLSNWSEGLNTSFGSLHNFFFGADLTALKDTNFHNYFFDIVVRFGFPITFVVVFSLVIMSIPLWKRTGQFIVYRLILIGVITNVMLHSTFNSALSQSMYITCLALTLGALKYFTKNIEKAEL